MAKKVMKDLLKKSMSSGDKSSAAQAVKAMAAKAIGAKKKMAPSIQVDSTKKVTMGGNAKPSVMIKKQTTVKPSNKKPLLYEFDKMPSKMKKRMDNFNKSKKVEYKPLAKK
jgi:hypothetical protein